MWLRSDVPQSWEEFVVDRWQPQVGSAGGAREIAQHCGEAWGSPSGRGGGRLDGSVHARATIAFDRRRSWRHSRYRLAPTLRLVACFGSVAILSLVIAGTAVRVQS